MNTENILVLDEDERVLFIDQRVLSFINTKQKMPLGSAEGKIEMGDLLIYFTKDSEKKCDEISTILSSISCSKSILQAERFIMVSCLEEEDLLPLVKIDLEENPNNIIFLDTIYESNEIMVKKLNNTLTVTLNGQSVSCPYDQSDSMYIIAKDNTIRFFSHTTNGDESLLQEILSKRKFPAWFNKKAVLEQKAKYVLNEDAYKAIKQFKDDNQKTESYLYLGTKPYKITHDRISLSNRAVHVFSFLDDEALMKEMSEDSIAYKQINASTSQWITPQQQFNSFRLWGDEDKIKQVIRLLQKSSVTNTTILLTGESGTGKTFLAGEIHKASRRNNGPFVHVNCAAIPYNLMESELFGYEEGAFTGARKGGKKGYFEMAFGGTLFLDEIAEIPLQLQGKLLEVIQSKTFYHVGGTRQIISDVRLVAATNKNLKEMVREKRFREDLYYRINVFPINIPPLRERKESLYSIIMDLLPDVCNRLGIEPLILSSQAYKKISQYQWPGNIRELENILEKAAILSDGKIILADDILLSEGLTTFLAEPVTLQEVRDNAEREAIINALRLFQGDKIKAAKYLDIGRTNIFEKIKKFHIKIDEVEQ